MKKFLLFLLMVTFPSWVLAQTITFTNPLRSASFQRLVENTINVIFTLSLPLTVVMIVVGGIIMVTAGGSEAQIESGKKIITYTLIGFLIVLMSKGIMALIEYLVK